jgi:succinate dehydrogenase flavin-adding protein (antitoxin of CptAB toxin-antitoxin module)
MKELQGQDNVLSQIIDYLENDNLPESQKEARRILLQSADYAVIDSILFHSRITKARRNKMMEHLFRLYQHRTGRFFLKLAYSHSN